MASQDDRFASVEVQMLDDDGVQELIKNALALAGCSWEALQEQARAGKFTSEVAREAWFVVSTFAEPSPV